MPSFGECIRLGNALGLAFQLYFTLVPLQLNLVVNQQSSLAVLKEFISLIGVPGSECSDVTCSAVVNRNNNGTRIIFIELLRVRGCPFPVFLDQLNTFKTKPVNVYVDVESTACGYVELHMHSRTMSNLMNELKFESMVP